MTAINWAAGYDGDWSYATMWNPQQVPGPGDDATISYVNSSGYGYYVTINSPESVDTLTVDAAEPGGVEVYDDSLLMLTGALTVIAGTFYLEAQAIIEGGTIVSSSGTLYFEGGTLDDVTYDGPMNLTLVGSSVVILDGITLTGQNGTGPGAIDMGNAGPGSNAATLGFVGDQTIDNATITEYFSADIYTYNTLTLGSKLTIDQIYDSSIGGGDPSVGSYEGTIINKGTINAEDTGVYSNSDAAYSEIDPSDFINSGSIVVFADSILLIDPDSFTNAVGGVITVGNGATLTIRPHDSWTNAGLITVQAGGTLHLQSEFTAAGIVNDGGVIYIDGTLDNNGNVLAVGPGSAFGQVVLDGTILNGTVQDAGSGIVFGVGTYGGVPQIATLDGVTYEGTLDLSPEDSVVIIADGITLKGADGTGPGAIDLGTYSSVYIADSQTIDNATITMGYYAIVDEYTTSDYSSSHNGATATLTLGPNLTIDQDSAYDYLYGDTIINDGTINAEASGGYIQPTTFVNAGSIVVFSGVALSVDPASFTNAATGAITVQTGATLNIGTTSSWTNDGLIQLSGGTLQVGSADIDSTGTLIGYGVANLADGGNTVAKGGLLDITGDVTGTGGLYIDQGSTLELGGADANTVTFQGANATLLLDKPQEFTGQIAGFALGDVVDLRATTVTGVTPLSSTSASTTLQLTLLGASPIDLTLLGNFIGDIFITPVDGAGTGTDLTINGAYALAAPLVEPTTEDFGAVHVDDTPIATLVVSNTAAAPAEGLDASVSSNSPEILAAGSINLLAAGQTDDTSLLVGLLPASDGIVSGTVTVALQSDGAGTSGAGLTPLPAQFVQVVGTVYAYATPVFSATELDLGAARVGDPALQGAVTLADGSAYDPYQESLVYAAGGDTGTIVSGASDNVYVALGTGTAGDFTGDNARIETVDLTSTGVGTSGLADTPLAPVLLTVSAQIYAPAVADYATTLNFGIVHAGEPDYAALTIANNATGALTDSLIGGVASISNSAFSATGDLGDVPAGTAGALGFALDTGTAGTFNATATLALASHDDVLSDLALSTDPVALSGTVNNYATAAVEELFAGGGVLDVTNGTIALGSFLVGAVPVVIDLAAANSAVGPADALSGSFAVSGSSAFTNTGLSAFAGLAAGQADTAPSVTLSTTAAGTFSETITLDATGSNSSGYSGALAPETLTITGTVLGALTVNAPAQAAVGLGQTDPIAGLSLSETGNTTGRFTVTVSDTSGLLTANGVGVGLTGAGTRSLTISGPLAQVNAALATLKDTETTAASDTLTITASDAYGNQAAASVAVTVNAAPTVTAPATAVVGIGQADPVAGISVAEAGLTAGEGFTVTVQDQRGLLSASAVGGVTVTGAGTVAGLTITGTLAQVNAALATLTDTAGDTASDKILVFVTDSLGNHAHAGLVAVTTNGKPVLTAPAAAAVGVGQPSPIAGLGVAESGTTAGETFSVVASDAGGALSASGAGGAAIAGAGTGSLTISGTLAQVNAALATLKDAAPATPSDTLTLQVTDSLHNSGTASVALTVNGPPVIAAPAAATVAVGQTVAIGGLSLSETGNTAGERFSVTLSDANGLLTASGAGVTLTGSGSTSLTISGQLAQVNAALATLKDSDATAPSDTLTLAASDAYGNTASRTVAVTVNPAPVVQAPASATAVLGQAVAIGGVTIAESGSTAGESFTVTVQDQRGLLAATAVGGAVVSGSGTVAGLTISGTLAQVNAALATLTDSVGDTSPDKILVFATDSYGNHAHAGNIAVGVNGKPVLTTPAAAAVAVDQATAIPGVSLAESGTTAGEIFSVTLTDTAGLLAASGASVAVSGSGTTSLTISGQLAQVNAALATLTDTAPGTAADSIALTASDSYGGVATAAAIPVTVSGVAAPAATASVRAAALHLGGVADPAWGSGEGGVTVSLLNGMGMVIGTAVTTAAGQANFGNLAAGTYQLQYTAPAGQGFVPGGPDSAAGVTAPFSVAAGQALIAPAGDLMATLALNGSGLDATPAAGGYLVTGDAADSTLTLGSYNAFVTLTGGGDTVTTGNGNQTIVLSGSGNTVTVGVGNSVINAGDGGAVVHAAGGAVTITAAGAGNLLDGGSGLSFLNADGSAGNVFMLAAAGTPAANMTTVSGFNPVAGDILDLKHTLAGVDILPDLSNLGSFVTAAAAGPNTVLLVDPTGGSATPTAFATLLNTHVSVAQLQALHEVSVS